MINNNEEEEEYDEDEIENLNFYSFNNINIYSTSPLEKGIIFSKIENKISEEITFKSETLVKYNLVLEQIKINDIHRQYNKKIYDIVLLQLTKDRQMRYGSMMWNNFIKSF